LARQTGAPTLALILDPSMNRVQSILAFCGVCALSAFLFCSIQHVISGLYNLFNPQTIFRDRRYAKG